MAESDNYEEEIKAALQNNDQARAAEKAQKYLEKLNNVRLNIAITGESGAGKSTLVNALRGIKNKTEGAAPTGVKETTMAPTPYILPEMPNVTIWDLPGVGTTNFTADKYIKMMPFEMYDFFIIVSCDRFKENDAKLAKEIQKMKKKFYFVRSKIDHNIQDEKEEDPNVEEEEVLKIVRNDCTEELQKLGFESPKVFLVSGLKLHLFEFKDLRKTLMEELPGLLRDVLVLALPNISLEAIEQKKKTLERIIMAESNNYEEEIKAALQNNDQARAAEKAQKYLEKINNVPLTVAITGESGSGKSTLVNALRGIKNNTEGAASTGVKETTMKPTPYIHPEMPNVTIWDLPGVGTTNFTADKYIKEMKIEKYDFFIIVSCDRFRENDAKLAKEIQKMKKKFYFVRSKIDHNIQDEKEENSNVEEEEVLKIVKNDCTEELQKLGFESPKVFLVSGRRLHLYEFKDLWKTLMEELPQHLRNVLVLALPNISLEAIKQKKKTLESKIKWYSVTSTAVAGAPVPGLSDSVDLGMLIGFTAHCSISLGLTPKLLQKLSYLSGVPLHDLKAELKSPFAGVEITKDLVLKLLTQSAAVIAAKTVEEGARFVPIVGTVIAMAISGVTTYKVLKYILDTLAEDAQRVFIKAWGQNTSG